MVTWSKAGVDLGGVRKLYANSAVAKIVFDYFATRKRNKRETSVDRLYAVLLDQGQRVSRREIRNLLVQLADLHCGKFILGRRGGETRIEWSVGFIRLGQAASGEPTEITELTEDEVVKGDEDEADEHEFAAAEGTPAADMKIKYPLRPARDVEFLLPKDLTTREAHRLAEFIRTLPFDDATTAA